MIKFPKSSTARQTCQFPEFNRSGQNIQTVLSAAPAPSLPQLLHLSCCPMEKIWGGSKLARKKNIPLKNIGETWELSVLEEGPCHYQDRPLKEFIGSRLQEFWGEDQELTYLVKFIDTSDVLSIQVHPDDAYAQLHEKTSGKTECWIILEAEPHAGIYLGFKEGVNPEEFAARIHRQEDISDCLNFHEVQKGDFFYVPAGTVHAIGKGILLLEVQQSSGITYRVWDWNRRDDQGNPRNLHIKKALEVMKFENEFNNPQYFRIKKSIFSIPQKLESLIEHPQFHLQVCHLTPGKSLTIDLSSGKRARAIICTHGTVWVHRGEEKIKLQELETATLPFSGESEIQIESNLSANIVFVS